MGKKLGVHRTYWGSGSVASAVKTAKADAANHRVPWMSFKAPYSWSQMATGKGDAWARNLATKMRAVPGPVWVAVVHEPENDGGDIQQWKKMQARLAPIMRKTAPNLAYSIILMGYHEFQGAAKYRMSAIWPNTKIDVAGFDIYETYGAKQQRLEELQRQLLRADPAVGQGSGRPMGPGRDGLLRPGGEEEPGLDPPDLPGHEGPRRHRVLLLQHHPAQHGELEAGAGHQEERLHPGQPRGSDAAVVTSASPPVLR